MWVCAPPLRPGWRRRGADLWRERRGDASRCLAGRSATFKLLAAARLGPPCQCTSRVVRTGTCESIPLQLRYEMTPAAARNSGRSAERSNRMTVSFTSPLALAGEGAGGACPRAGRMIDCPLRPQVISGPECDVGLCPALAARLAAPRRRLVEREARGCEPLPCLPQRDLHVAGRCATRPTLPVRFASRRQPVGE